MKVFGVGAGIWGITLAFVPLSALTDILYWIGGTIILGLGAIVWLVFCLALSLLFWTKVEGWIRDNYE